MIKINYTFRDELRQVKKDYGSSEGCTHNYEEIRIFRRGYNRD
jgi:hypothetical protein